MSFRDPFGRRAETLLEELPLVAMVIAAEDIEWEMEPDILEQKGAD